MFQAMTLRRTFMVVPASPVGPSSRRRCRSRGGVGSGRCGEAEHLGDAVAREIRVFSYDVLVRHALGQARQDERRREACSPDRGFPAQAFGIRHEVSEPGIGVSSMSSPSGGPHFHYGAPSRPKYTCLVGLGLTFLGSPSTHFTTGLSHSTRSTAAPPCSPPPHDRHGLLRS